MSTLRLSRRKLLRPWEWAREVLPPTPASSLARYLRPPGALPEAELIDTCRRCGACREACPAEAIRPLGPPYGEAEGTPAILPGSRACVLCEGLRCTKVCPSGALQPVELEDVRMGLAVLDPDRCWAVQGQPCDYCVPSCPRGETALRFVEGVPVVDSDGCVGCGQCEFICTATPPALRVMPEALGT